MFLEPRNAAIMISAACLVVAASAANAAKINGKQCAGMVSEQVNPRTGQKTYACRTVDGTIASGSSVEEKLKKDVPVKSANPPATPKKDPGTGSK